MAVFFVYLRFQNKNMQKIRGILWGILSGASFGLIPLFTLPLFASGITSASVLFYRFSVAAVLIGIILLIRGENLRISWKQAWQVVLLGVLYMASALFLIWGYAYMAAGVATTIHFLYPVCVVLILTIFFREKASLIKITAILLAIVGVGLLSSGDGASGAVNIKAVIIVVISSIAYALYIIGVKRFDVGDLSGFKLTFFVMSVSALIFLFRAVVFGGGITPLTDWNDIVNVLLLAIIPTIVSNFALVNAIKYVGSTTTSILGAFEPMTAVTIGVTVFDEPLTIVSIMGMLLIIASVTTIVLQKNK